MFKLIRYLKGYWAAAIAAPLFKIMEAIFELIVPMVVAAIVNVGIAGGDVNYIITAGLIMLLLGALGLGFSTTCQYLAARASIGYGTNLRTALFKHVNTLSFGELDKYGAASLITRLNADVNQTQMGVAMFIRLVLRAPIILIGATVMAIIIDAKLSLIFIAAAVAVSIILALVMTKTMPGYKKVQHKLDKVTELTKENLSGARVVRAFSRQREEEADFYAAADDLNKTSYKVSRVAALLSPLTYAVVNLAIVAILWFGGNSVSYGNLKQGDIIALVNYLTQILLALVVMANLIVTFTKSSACAARINEVFAETPSITEPDSPTPERKEGAPKLEFDGVSFAYAGSGGESLKNISFALGAGKTLGVIGGTGSGKTTLVNLIPRFYDASGGAVRIDGVDVKEYKSADLRGKIGIAMQRTSLFRGTVRDNIKWGKPDATDEEIWQALDIAQAADFVRALPEGLDAPVYTAGRNFSGGQRQRLNVARAVVNKPEILLLDDTSSALDNVTDARMRKAIRGLDNVTVVVVSQRTNAIMDADEILVLEDGEPVGLGTHDELLVSCGVYRDIYESQFGETAANSASESAVVSGGAL